MTRPNQADGTPWSPPALALVLALVVVTAGCAGIGGAGDSPTTATTEAGSATPVPTTTGGSSHSHDDPTTEAGATETDPATTGSADSGESTGAMTVVVAGEEVTEGETIEAEQFSYEAGESHTWRASGDVTLAEALEEFDVEVSGETLAYEGTTYDDQANGTSVSVRVNGDPVTPSTYTLADGDEVWVTAETADMEVSTPGEYIDNEDQHIHGHMALSVDGEAVDFGRDRYQSNDRYFHYEGGEGSAWHAHSYTVTLEYALSSLDGIDVNADGTVLTYDGTTYRASDPGTTITVEVNGEPVEPGSYYLKDWDGVRVVVEDSG